MGHKAGITTMLRRGKKRLKHAAFSMKTELTADESPEGFRINAITKTSVQVGEAVYTQGLAICAAHLSPWQWPMNDGLIPQLSWQDVPEWAAAKVPNLEIILLGINDAKLSPRDRQFQTKLQAECAAKRIGVEVMRVDSAARTYNILLNDGRGVLALLWMGAAAAATD